MVQLIEYISKNISALPDKINSIYLNHRKEAIDRRIGKVYEFLSPDLKKDSPDSISLLEKYARKYVKEHPTEKAEKITTAKENTDEKVSVREKLNQILEHAKVRLNYMADNAVSSAKYAVTHPIEYAKAHLDPTSAYRFSNKKIEQTVRAYVSALNTLDAVLKINTQDGYNPNEGAIARQAIARQVALKSLSKGENPPVRIQILEAFIGDTIDNRTSSYRAYNLAGELFKRTISTQTSGIDLEAKAQGRTDIAGLTIYHGKNIEGKSRFWDNTTRHSDEGAAIQKQLLSALLLYIGVGAATLQLTNAGISTSSAFAHAGSSYAISRAKFKALSAGIRNTTKLLTDNSLVQSVANLLGYASVGAVEGIGGFNGVMNIDNSIQTHGLEVVVNSAEKGARNYLRAPLIIGSAAGVLQGVREQLAKKSGNFARHKAWGIAGTVLGLASMGTLVYGLSAYGGDQEKLGKPELSATEIENDNGGKKIITIYDPEKGDAKYYDVTVKDNGTGKTVFTEIINDTDDRSFWGRLPLVGRNKYVNVEIDNLKPGEHTTYRATVTAGDKDGNTSSDTIFFRTHDEIPPKPPTSGQYSKGGGIVELNWDESISRDVKSYDTYEVPQIGEESKIRENDPQNTIISLFSGSLSSGEHKYRVYAVDYGDNKSQPLEITVDIPKSDSPTQQKTYLANFSNDTNEFSSKLDRQSFILSDDGKTAKIIRDYDTDHKDTDHKVYLSNLTHTPDTTIGTDELSFEVSVLKDEDFEEVVGGIIVNYEGKKEIVYSEVSNGRVELNISDRIAYLLSKNQAQAQYFVCKINSYSESGIATIDQTYLASYEVKNASDIFAGAVAPKPISTSSSASSQIIGDLLSKSEMQFSGEEGKEITVDLSKYVNKGYENGNWSIVSDMGRTLLTPKYADSNFLKGHSFKAEIKYDGDSKDNLEEVGLLYNFNEKSANFKLKINEIDLNGEPYFTERPQAQDSGYVLVTDTAHTFHYKAKDPNEDPVTYGLDIRRTFEQNKSILEKIGIKNPNELETLVKINTSNGELTFEGGMYKKLGEDDLLKVYVFAVEKQTRGGPNFSASNYTHFKFDTQPIQPTIVQKVHIPLEFDEGTGKDTPENFSLYELLKIPEEHRGGSFRLESPIGNENIKYELKDDKLDLYYDSKGSSWDPNHTNEERSWNFVYEKPEDVKVRYEGDIDVNVIDINQAPVLGKLSLAPYETMHAKFQMPITDPENDNITLKLNYEETYNKNTNTWGSLGVSKTDLKEYIKIHGKDVEIDLEGIDLSKLEKELKKSGDIKLDLYFIANDDYSDSMSTDFKIPVTFTNLPAQAQAQPPEPVHPHTVGRFNPSHELGPNYNLISNGYIGAGGYNYRGEHREGYSINAGLNTHSNKISIGPGIEANIHKFNNDKIDIYSANINVSAVLPVSNFGLAGKASIALMDPTHGFSSRTDGLREMDLQVPYNIDTTLYWQATKNFALGLDGGVGREISLANPTTLVSDDKCSLGSSLFFGEENPLRAAMGIENRMLSANNTSTDITDTNDNNGQHDTYHKAFIRLTELRRNGNWYGLGIELVPEKLTFDSLDRLHKDLRHPQEADIGVGTGLFGGRLELRGDIKLDEPFDEIELKKITGRIRYYFD